MPRTRYRFVEEQGTYFVTSSVLNWVPVFTFPTCAKIVLDALSWMNANTARLHAYIIMTDHLHLVLSSEDAARAIARFRSHSARSIVDCLQRERRFDILSLLKPDEASVNSKQTYQIWQTGTHPQLIESDVMFAQKLDYIHENPVAKGYVDQPGDWRYSSARNYAGEPGLIDVETEFL